MDRSEITIFMNEVDKDMKVEMTERLITALAWAGYSPYINWQNNVCFSVDNEESIQEVKNDR